jgi:hypothetical protein|tara:strand:+ start:794 stop:1060 length:267 start_codon:yes stop_codon:yes gene_type:complete
MRYLLIQFVRKPNGQIDEAVTVAKKVKQSDVQTMNVILDYATKKVEKCIIEGKQIDTDWDRMNAYYKKIYPTLIDQLEKEAGITAKEQ